MSDVRTSTAQSYTAEPLEAAACVTNGRHVSQAEPRTGDLTGTTGSLPVTVCPECGAAGEVIDRFVLQWARRAARGSGHA